MCKKVLKALAKTLLKVMLTVLLLTIAAAAAYWFELDTLIIKKFEPTFRKLAHDIQ